jgi:hypothetical protein
MARRIGFNVAEGSQVATGAQKHCSGFAKVLFCYDQQDLICASAVLLRGVCPFFLIAQIDTLTTCPIEQGGGARKPLQHIGISVNLFDII